MLLARSHDLMHFVASSGCSWQRLQPWVPHASRQHWHASLHAHWCCGYVRAGVARIAAAWLLLLVAGVADAALIPSSHSHLDLSKDTLAAALCCCFLLPLLCASLCTVAVSLCEFLSMLLWCCVVCVCVCVFWREGREGERRSKHNLSNKAKQSHAKKAGKKSAPKKESGKQDVPKWKARQNTTSKAQATEKTFVVCLVLWLVRMKTQSCCCCRPRHAGCAGCAGYAGCDHGWCCSC